MQCCSVLWAVPTPTPNAPLRKEVERKAGDPEGNLVIVEKGACREAIRLPEAEG